MTTVRTLLRASALARALAPPSTSTMMTTTSSSSSSSAFASFARSAHAARAAAPCGGSLASTSATTMATTAVARAVRRWSASPRGFASLATCGTRGAMEARASTMTASTMGSRARAWTPTRPLAASSPLSSAGAARTMAKKITPGKKIKIKPYSSWKGRFQVTGSGKKILRRHKGKRHKSFAKSPKQRRDLRGTTLVHASLLGPMRKLNFKMR